MFFDDIKSVIIKITDEKSTIDEYSDAHTKFG